MKLALSGARCSGQQQQVQRPAANVEAEPRTEVSMEIGDGKRCALPNVMVWNTRRRIAEKTSLAEVLLWRYPRLLTPWMLRLQCRRKLYRFLRFNCASAFDASSLARLPIQASQSQEFLDNFLNIFMDFLFALRLEVG